VSPLPPHRRRRGRRSGGRAGEPPGRIYHAVGAAPTSIRRSGTYPRDAIEELGVHRPPTGTRPQAREGVSAAQARL